MTLHDSAGEPSLQIRSGPLRMNTRLWHSDFWCACPKLTVPTDISESRHTLVLKSIRDPCIPRHLTSRRECRATRRTAIAGQQTARPTRAVRSCFDSAQHDFGRTSHLPFRPPSVDCTSGGAQGVAIFVRCLCLIRGRPIYIKEPGQIRWVSWRTGTYVVHARRPPRMGGLRLENRLPRLVGLLR